MFSLLNTLSPFHYRVSIIIVVVSRLRGYVEKLENLIYVGALWFILAYVSLTGTAVKLLPVEFLAKSWIHIMARRLVLVGREKTYPHIWICSYGHSYM